MTTVFQCQRHTTIAKDMRNHAERLEALESRPNPELLLPEITALRRVAEGAAAGTTANTRMLEQVVDEQSRIRHIVNGLVDKLDDSREQTILELKEQMRFMLDTVREERQSRHEIDVETRRDEADERRARRALRAKLVGGVISIILALLGAYQGGRASASPQCSHSVVGR